jgi:hypothetical protein
MKSKTDGKLTRRELVRRVTAAAAGSALLGRTTFARSIKRDHATCCGTQQLPQGSVFTTVCDDQSALKYANGDNPVVYRLGAMWLMLVTEDWTSFYRDKKNPDNEKNFLQGLSDELKINLIDVQQLWDISQDKSQTLEDLRAAWQNLTSNKGIYGARPCPGGKSALSIASLDPNDERKAPMLKTLKIKSK